MTSRAYRENYNLIKWTPIAVKASREPKRQSRAFYIIPDISPYRSVITGEVIGGRVRHRDHLREHGVIEVGNEKPKRRKPETVSDVRQDARIALEMVRSGYKPRPPDTYRDE